MNKCFHGLLVGVSVLPALLVMPAVAEIPAPVDGVLTNVTVSGETANRLYNLNTANNDLTINNSTFLNNNGTVAWATGPDENVGNTLIVNDSTFSNNAVSNSYGTISAGSYGKYLNINKSTFTSNSSSFGGAVFSSAKDGTKIDDVTFAGNSAETTAGAVYAGSKASVLSSRFNGNTAIYAGAIYSETDLEVKNSSFESNEAQKISGAINISGKAKITDSTFKNNITHGEQDGEGNDTFTYTGTNGRIYDSESGAIGIAADSDVTVTGSSFEQNIAGIGGALGNGSMVTVKNSTFNKNYAVSQGGAIINFLYSKSTQTVQDIKETIDNVSFTQNHAKLSGGAIASFSMSDIKNSKFIGNYTESTSFGEGGGAMFVGAESLTKITDSLFQNNTSASAGGAIMTRSADIANNAAAKLDITGTTFKGNTAATTGGALDTYFYNSEAKEFQIYVDNSTFDTNKAAQGGAIFNHGLEDRAGNKASMHLKDVTFTGNTATQNGGAIYNESTVELAGDNTFTGNKANGKANDIYNLGDINIVSGTTTLDGGIDGNGTLSIANGATLNIGNATINQSNVNLGGTLIATVRDGDAQLNVSDAFDGDGNLSLVFKDSGTYHVFGNKVFAKAKDQVSSSIYDISWTNGDKDIVATLKSASDLAAENNLSENSAAAILGMAQSSSEKLNDIAEQIQEKLASGTDADKAAVEYAAKAVHPETESVTQSVATSVQTTVTNLASVRMATPMVGRNGGDVELTSGGVWVQGLFNKSKQNDAFRGYTRGVAAGLDGTINKVWTIGAGYSFAHSDINGTSRDTEIDSNTVFVYGQYKPTEWYLNAVANYTWSDFEESADVFGTHKSSDYDVDSFGGTIATGYNFDNGITPELGLRYMHVDANDYTDSFGTKIKSKDADFLTGVLGAKYAFNVIADRYTTFVPQLNAAIKYDMLSDRNMSTVMMPGVDAYTLRGERLSRVGGEFGIGFGMKHRGVDISINYDIDVRKDYTSQTGMLKFRYNF